MTIAENDNSRRWQFSICELLAFTAGIGLSLGLFRGSYVVEWPAGFALAHLGLTCLGATVGGLIGRLRDGRRLATENGMTIGAACGLAFPCSFPLLLIVGLSVIAAWISTWLDNLCHTDADPEQS